MSTILPSMRSKIVVCVRGEYVMVKIVLPLLMQKTINRRVVCSSHHQYHRVLTNIPALILHTRQCGVPLSFFVVVSVFPFRLRSCLWRLQASLSSFGVQPFSESAQPFIYHVAWSGGQSTSARMEESWEKKSMWVLFIWQMSSWTISRWMPAAWDRERTKWYERVWYLSEATGWASCLFRQPQHNIPLCIVIKYAMLQTQMENKRIHKVNSLHVFEESR